VVGVPPAEWVYLEDEDKIFLISFEQTNLKKKTMVARN